jgi:branched-chain amino acid transport system permease protein
MVPFALIALIVVHRLVRSRIGRTLLAIKYNEAVARSQGINPLTHRLLAFGISAAMSGVVGGIYAFFLTIVDPSIFDFYYIESMLIMTIIGGPGSFWGVLIASVLFVVLPDMLRFSTDLRMVLYGAVLVLAMLLFPQGFGGLYKRMKARRA